MFFVIFKKLKNIMFDYYITKMFGSSKNKNVFVPRTIVPKKENVKSKALNGYENIREKIDDNRETPTGDIKALKKKVSIGL